MPLSEEEEQAIDQALKEWRQGDFSLDAGLEFVHLADLSHPHSSASIQFADALSNAGEDLGASAEPVINEVPGLVMLSQTCDVIRGCRDRPFVEVAPLFEVDEQRVEEIRRLKRPAFAYVPATAAQRLVAHLDRTMTVEKALVAAWTRRPGWETDDQLRDFAQALARKRSRFAFPDDFVAAAQYLSQRLTDKHNRQTEEGARLRALREIRVRAAPSWDHAEVQLSWWFVKEDGTDNVDPDWQPFLNQWLALFDRSARFQIEAAVACRLEDMTAKDYVESDALDLDHLSGTDRSNEALQ